MEKRKTKSKKDGKSNIGEYGGKIEIVKDGKFLKNEGEKQKGSEGDEKADRMKSKGVRDVGVEGDNENMIKSNKIKGHVEGKRVSQEGKAGDKKRGNEHVEVVRDGVEKVGRKEGSREKDKKKRVSGHCNLEDAGLSIGDEIQKGDIVETGEGFNGSLVEKVRKKKRKREKESDDVEGKRIREEKGYKHTICTEKVDIGSTVAVKKAGSKERNGDRNRKMGVSGHQLLEHNVKDVGLAMGDEIQDSENVGAGEGVDGGVVGKVGKKKRKREKKKNEVEGMRDRKEGALGDLVCSENVDVKSDLMQKVERREKNREKDKKEGGSIHQRLEHYAEDVGLSMSGEIQHSEVVQTGGVDGGVVEKVRKKKKTGKKKDEVVLYAGASPYTSPSDATQVIENTNDGRFETLNEICGKDVRGKARKKERFKICEKEVNASDAHPATDDDLTKNEKGNGGKRKNTESVENGCQDSEPAKRKKKVKFSNHVEVFPSQQLVQGKRFTPEEDEIVKKAVYDYIEAHCLGDEGLNMVLNCRSYPQLRGCWKEIASAMPYRQRDSFYYRAQNLFRRSETRKWSEEEKETVIKFQQEHGNQWKLLADELHKHRFHVKDTWRRIKNGNLKKGQWAQEEYQNLFDLVNLDLRLRIYEEKKSKHGMLRDNICWTAISDKLSTRANAVCCQKWYKQLTSSMVAGGEWADTDDYRLINALYELDASCIEDVNWDDLLEHRSGDVCQKRWKEMTLHIGYHGNQSFVEQVEVLAKRYCPELLEFREAWDKKPLVP